MARASVNAVPPPEVAARALIRGAKEATLATVSASGQPFASLVTPATAPDLTVLLWLSQLSGHTRHLMADGRCSLLFVGPAAGPNPQKRPRVTVTGVAERVEGEAAALKPRWLARHPYAGLYANLPDFALWRVVPQEALYVGGFAMARRLPGSALRPDADAVAALAAAEAEILDHVNTEHADAVAVIVGRLLHRAGRGWRMVAVDVDGCDFARGNRVARLAFLEPVRDPDGVRRALILAARAARGRAQAKTMGES
jgi:putative heme iron utilization protein